jgi:hypothetical protein
MNALAEMARLLQPRQTRGRRAAAEGIHFGSEGSLVGLQARLQGPAPSPLEAVALVEQREAVMRRLEPLPPRQHFCTGGCRVRSAASDVTAHLEKALQGLLEGRSRKI